MTNYAIRDTNVEYKDSMGTDISVVDDARISHLKESSFVPFDRAKASFETFYSTRKEGLEKTGDDLRLDEKYVSYLYELNDIYDTDEVSYSERSFLNYGDFRLIHFLMKGNNHHWSPFAHSFVKFRIKCPLIVARQLVKHQVGLTWNEVSRRYVSDNFEFLIPEKWRGKPLGSIKQGSNPSANLDHKTISTMLLDHVDNSMKLYEGMLKMGVAPEMARMVLPQNMMVDFVWTGSLYAWSRVANLRIYPDAQPETKEVAVGIHTTCKDLFPVAWKVLTQNVWEYV